MTERAKLGREVLLGAIVLGILGDALLRAGPWSVNLTLWTVTVIAGTVALAARHRVDWPRDTAWLAAPVVLFALAFSWRASPVLLLANLFAVGVGISMWTLSLERSRIPFCSLQDYARGAVNTGMAALRGVSPLNRAELAIEPGTTTRWSRARPAVVGLLFALPLLFVFGGLLMAADAVFDQMMSTAFHLNFGRLVSHGVLFTFFAWVACGFLLLMLRFTRPTIAEPLQIERPSLGIVEVAVPLALVDLLFLAFVIVQLRYLFGDASLVERTVGLTYAEYARHGFFQLVTVVALVLPVLLAADWLLNEAPPASQRVYRMLARVTLLLLLVIVASALKRMMLYQDAYGLTDDRLYATAFMAWIGIVLVWFAGTVLHGRRRYFATGAAVAGLCIIAALDIINPDALIARTNLERATDGMKFDAVYHLSLSADAAPTLVSGLIELGHDEGCIIAARLLARWGDPAPGDWRTWNAGRSKARRFVAGQRPGLEARACDPGPAPQPTEPSADVP